MKHTKIFLAGLLAIGSPAIAEPGTNGDQPFDWCTRTKQRFGYEAPTGTLQPCFQVDHYRGNGDDNRSVGWRGEKPKKEGSFDYLDDLELYMEVYLGL